MADRVAIVTGAAQGMGRACAIELARKGHRIVINDLSATGAEAVVRELRSLGAEAVSAMGDVANGASVERLVGTALEKFGSIDILINSAGILKPTEVAGISEAEWDLVVGVNMKGTFLCSQAVLPSMRGRGWGRIVNFSSTAGKNVSTLGGAHYTAAKAGVLGLTRHFAKEVAGDGITVNAVCPGLIDTPMVRNSIGQERIDAYAGSFPIKRLGLPEEVADLVCFLASDNAAYITGASLDINGGDLMV
ncbi:SDR family NAD(P)-dependent oxidoreductase [Chelativorans sp. AA-79]|uniref:SDR family NAD(P)-dependent oxidoreductase n=1 Tax=Chelativorans sp. AA-79 TaxID=3028735 RepID=UPI0023F9B864|nr:SDR family NAD(P)-dependent oxidoreductase [Chelativorans sp. AA-79]WEX12419.1 SDR family NAD(P)-dependent oxidoreductase [Chelativorans sp. AA-79]